MLWDLNDGKHLYSLEAGDIVNALVFSPNRYWLCAATSSCVKIFDLESKYVFSQYRSIEIFLRCISLGRLLMSLNPRLTLARRLPTLNVFPSPGLLMARLSLPGSLTTSSVSGLSARDDTKYHMYGRCTGLVLHYFAVQSYLPFDTRSTSGSGGLNSVTVQFREVKRHTVYESLLRNVSDYLWLIQYIEHVANLPRACVSKCRSTIIRSNSISLVTKNKVCHRRTDDSFSRFCSSLCPSPYPARNTQGSASSYHFF